jgi:hypothetical protein
MSLQARAERFLGDFNESLKAMSPRDIQMRLVELAERFLHEFTDCLIAAPHVEIKTWPGPFSKETKIEGPPELSRFRFDACRDLDSDGSIAVVVTCRWNPAFWYERVHADGFYVSPDSRVARFAKDDVYGYT